MTNNEHFIRCAECGEMVDQRDLSEVFKHLHDDNIDPSSVIGITSKKVGDPVEWKDSKPTHLN